MTACRFVSVHDVRAGARRDDAPRRKPGGEAASGTGDALDLQGSLVPRERVLDDGEAETGAPGLARAAAVHAIEALGEPRDMLGLDAHARVLHRELGTLCRASPDEADFSSRWGIPHGVAREIAECARDLRLRSQEVEAGLGV